MHSTLLDVLYYLTPVHCQDIVDSVVNGLNNTYRHFLNRNPNFTGKVC
jgi:hypothetical protein